MRRRSSQTSRPTALGSKAIRPVSVAKYSVRAGLVLWFVTPLAAITILLMVSSHQTLVGPASPVWVTAVASTDSSSIPVDIALVRSQSAALYAPAWSGVVQSVEIEGGSRIQDGDALMRIDGVQRIGARTSQPFHRPISHGSAGDDVGDLNEFLKRQGLPHDQGAIAGNFTVSGIQKFAVKVGAGGATSFDPSWVVYLPSDQFQVMKMELEVGQTAPAPGSAIATSTPIISYATVVTQGVIPVNSDGLAGATVDLISAERLAVDVPSDVTLRFGGQEIALSDDRKSLSPIGLAVIQGLAPTSGPVVQAVLSRPASDGDVVIPSSGLIAGSGGATCIVRQGDASSHRVSVIDERNGQSIIQGDVKVGDRIEMFPKGDTRACS